MPLHISSQEESINWYFSLYGQIFQEEEVKRIIWGIKGEIFFLLSFQFLTLFFKALHLFGGFGWFFFSFISC